MTDVLKHLYNACNPLTPASPEYYVDCSAVRGSNALTRQFQQKLAQTDGYLCFLFSGHIGCGKSSELHHLREALDQQNPTPPNKRYFPVFLNSEDYLDNYDVTPTDILLAIITELAATLYEKAGIKLEDNFFTKRLNEVKEFFLSEVEAKEGEVSLFGVKLKIQRLKKDPDARAKVREKLLPQMTSILAEINTVFDEARLKLKQAIYPKGDDHYTDIVLILDNLEKIERIPGHKEGEESQRELFIDRATQLKGLNAHVIYTVPLRLVRSDGPQLRVIYGVTPFVLPMIKVAERGGTHTPYEPGKQCLRDLIQKRAGNTPLDEVFTQEALEWLLTYSGGHVRDLMSFIQEASTYTDGLPIGLQSAKLALRQTISLYSTSIRAAHWDKLVKPELSADQEIDNNDPDYQTMLEQISIMEYMNGGEEENPFEPAEPWYAVNPIVRELRHFRATLRALQGQHP